MVPNSMEANFKRERATGREREREREREGGREGGREMISNFVASTERFCSVNRAILKRQQRENKEFISAQARRAIL